MELHHDARLHLALVVRRLVFVVRLAQERQRAAVGAGRRLDDVRHEPLVGDCRREYVRSLPLPLCLRLAVGAQFDFELAFAFLTSLPSMWLRRSKSPRWAMPSSSPNSPAGRNGNAYSMSAVPHE